MNAEIIRMDTSLPADAALGEQIGALQGLILKMSLILEEQDRRIREMEDRQKKVTISHREVLGLMARIRRRADEYGEKYDLTGKKDIAAFRGAIKKGVMEAFGIRDLHDLPECEKERAGRFVDGWTNIRLVMKRREAGNPPP